MEINHYLKPLNNVDLNMYQCGREDCDPSHSFGPAIRDHYLIHYILSGKGSFRVGDKVYHLKKGQGFLICPEIVTYYQADEKEPWIYSWVGFNGLKAEEYLKNANLTAKNPVFTYQKDKSLEEYLAKMVDIKHLSDSGELRLLGLLYLFLAKLTKGQGGDFFSERGEDRKDIYIKRAIEYIERNYSRKLSVAEIANYIGLHRSYFYSIFKENIEISPQEFIIEFRLNKACELMKKTKLTIGDISRSVGYDDPLLFSRIFKKIKGVSPSKYRKIN